MLKIIIYFILLTPKYVISKYEKIDIEWDEELRSIDEDFKCGIENKYKPSGTARIVNGRRTTNIRYPWMAAVYNYSPVDLNTYQNFGECGGAIISEKSILTAGHCVCTLHLPKKRISIQRSLFSPTCIVDSDEPANQNRPENQVHYTFGSMKDLSFDDFESGKIEFNKDLRVYMYKYKPDWWYEKKMENIETNRFKNGDAAIIIDDSKLKLKSFFGIPICLPSPYMFLNTVKIKVKHVGRGTSYLENRLEKPIIHTCLTNGERINNARPWNTDFKFSPCKNYDRNQEMSQTQKSCIDLKDAKIKDSKGGRKYQKDLISTKLKIKFLGKSGKSDSKMEIEIPKTDVCEELSDKIFEKIEHVDKGGYFKLLQDDRKGPSKVVILDKSNKNNEFMRDLDYKKQYLEWEKNPSRSNSYCYNRKRVEQYGICEIENRLFPTSKGKWAFINYGFCGSSCRTPNPPDRVLEDWNTIYWETDAVYYEHFNNDEGNFSSKLVS